MSKTQALSFESSRDQSISPRIFSGRTSIRRDTKIVANQAPSKPNILFRFSMPLVRLRWWVFAIPVLISKVGQLCVDPMTLITVSAPRIACATSTASCTLLGCTDRFACY